MSYDIESKTPFKVDSGAVTNAENSASGFSEALSRVLPTSSSTRIDSTMESLPDPFSPAFSHVFFSGADRRILLDEVTHLCQFGNNMVVVVGEEGVGKSSFLNQARFELSEAAFCCHLTCSYGMSAESLLSQILTQLDIPTTDTASAGEMIATLRHTMTEDNLQRVVVIIDDAHELDDGILSALISLLQGHQGHHLHILMAGSPELIERLDGFDMVDVLVYDVTLKPLAQHETKEYLDFKLATAGYPEERFFSEEQVLQIWKSSNGYPAYINQQAVAQLYQYDFEGGEEPARATGLPVVHMSLLVVLLAGLILALLYMGGDDEPALNELAADTNNQATVASPAGEVDGQQSGPSPDKAVAGTAPLTAPINTPAATPTPTTTPVTTEQAAIQSLEARLAAAEAKLKQQQEAEVAARQAQQSAQSESQAQALIENPVAQGQSEEIKKIELLNEGKPVQQAAVDKQKPAEVQQVEKPTQAEALAPNLKAELQREAQALQSNTSSASSPQTQAQPIPDQSWLSSLNDDHYVLQVLAASQQSSIEQFVASQPNRQALKMITLSRDGKPWYVVVTGNYANTELARRAISELPQSQVNGGPWPRKVSDLKKEIASFGRN